MSALCWITRQTTSDTLIFFWIIYFDFELVITIWIETSPPCLMNQWHPPQYSKMSLHQNTWINPTLRFVFWWREGCFYLGKCVKNKLVVNEFSSAFSLPLCICWHRSGKPAGNCKYTHLTHKAATGRPWIFSVVAWDFIGFCILSRKAILQNNVNHSLQLFELNYMWEMLSDLNVFTWTLQIQRK